MKPELIIQDFKGIHNSDLDKTSARLIRGATWKKQRIIVIIPADKSIASKCALSLWNLGFPPNNGVAKILAQGMEVGDAYSTAIKGILEHPELKDWEYLLTIEHDNLPPSDGVFQLISRMEEHFELSCIGGLYFTKGECGVAQIWGDMKDPVLNFRPQIPKPGELIECYGTGMGFNLWRLKMFKDERLKKPWFQTIKGKDGMATQDLAFWTDARKYGYRCAIDCNVRVGHYDIDADIVW